VKDFKQILDAVKTVSDGQTIQIFVPSDGKKRIFKLLTAKQQKDLIKTVAEKNISPIIFVETLNKIINANSVEKYEYSVSDRTYIIAVLRAHSVSKDLIVNADVIDLTKLNDSNTKIDNSVLERILETCDLKINCRVPSLKEDSDYNTALIDVSKNKSASDVFGEVFIYEVSKYITSISSEVLGLDIKLGDLAVKQRCQLIESLPAKAYNEVIEYVNQVRSEENKNLIIDGRVIDIELDLTFFTA